MNYNLDAVRTKLGYLPQELKEHIHSVAKVARQMANHLGCDPQRAEVAALLHDVARAMSGEELLALAHAYGLSTTPLEEQAPVLLHGPVGAEIARGEFNIEEEEILEAVRWHTTGKAGMSLLTKIVFLADKLELDKTETHLFNSGVRQLAERDLDNLVLEVLNKQLAILLERGQLIHPASIEARNYLLMSKP